MSVLDRIFTGMQGMVAGLNLQLGTAPIPVVVRKKPAKREKLDPSTQITICKANRPETIKPMAFGLVGPTIYRKTYFVEIVFIGPHKSSNVGDLDELTDIREAIENCFKAPFSAPMVTGCPEVKDLDVLPDSFLAGNRMKAEYDYMSTIIAVTTISYPT